MRKIGLIGGMSWESTVTYYRRINQIVHDRLGGHHSAEIAMESVDFAPFEERLQGGAWGEIGDELAEAARRLERSSAACIALCTNTMHKVAPRIEAAIEVPLIHIADTVGESARGARPDGGYKRLGLLGTAFTMEDPFYRDRLADRFAIDVVIPNTTDRETVHRVIFDELVHGVVGDRSRDAYRAIVARLVAEGAEAVVLGCTEIGMLLGDGDATVPLLDTTELHAAAAVDFALAF